MGFIGLVSRFLGSASRAVRAMHEVHPGRNSSLVLTLTSSAPLHLPEEPTTTVLYSKQEAEKSDKAGTLKHEAIGLGKERLTWVRCLPLVRTMEPCF